MCPLVDRPNPRRYQFEQMTIRIAEIDAVSAAWPIGSAFDSDLVFGELLLPSRQFGCRDGKSHMNRSTAIVRRNGTAGQMERLERCTALKQQQHVAAADVESQEPRIACQRCQPQHIYVERSGAREVI